MDASNLPLRFTIDIFSAHFVTTGRYFLILRIAGSKVNPSTVKIYVGDSKVPLDDHEFTTDACLEDGDPETLATFTDSSISFWIPPESAEGDIQLMIEAFRLPENPMHEGDKYGEAVFNVFPRQGALFSAVRQKTPSTKDSKELYQFETNITLTEVLDNEGICTNCGVISAAVTLKHEEPEKKGEETDRQLSSVAVSEHIDSLTRKQIRARSLANLCPMSEFPLAKDKMKSPGTESRQPRKMKSNIKDDELVERENISVCRHSIPKRQEDAGSLANFCPSIEFGFDMKEMKKKRKEREGEDRSQLAGEEYVSPYIGQQHSGKLADSFLELGRTELVLDIPKHYSEEVPNVGEAQGKFAAEKLIEPKYRAENFDNVQPEDYHVNDSPVDLDAESYDSSIDQELQQIWQGTADDSSSFVEKKEKAEIGKSSISYRNVEAARLAFYRWKQREPMKEPKRVKPQLLPVPGDPGPGPSSASDTSMVVKTIQESALGPQVNSIPVQHLSGSYLAREGYCEVVILAHGALGLPFKSNRRSPQPYIAGKTGKADAQMQMGQSVTHAAIQPTQSPSWEELLLVEVREEETKDEVVILLVADHPSKELLTEYTVPLGHLKPFHQYHLELVQPNPELSGDIRLYITLIKKMDKLPLPSVGSKMYGLEVLLRSFEAPVSSQMGPLIATGRIVADWKEYKETMLSSQPRPTGVTVTTIHFPSPHPTSFAVAGATPVHGAPQVTTAGGPQEQPQWNQTMFFLGDESSLFTAAAALVVEYYPASLALTRDGWQLASPVGYSYQTLDQLLLSCLQWDSAKLGLRVDNLPVEVKVNHLLFTIYKVMAAPTTEQKEPLGSNLRTAIGTSPTVGVVLRLITDVRPDQLLSTTHLPSLPTFRTGPQTAQPGQPSHTASQQIDTTQQMPHGLPPMNAVKTILPQFHSLYTGPTTEPVREYVPLANLTSPAERGHVDHDVAGSSQIPPEVRGNLDIRSLAVMDYQMKEVDRYRTAMRKMATDLLHVREDCKRLEEANSRLRRELGQHDEISRLMVSSKDLDNVTHSELVQKFVLLKKKLADESTKKQELQARLQHLQNDLIKKNEMEKEFLKLQEAHEGQQALLQKLQGKVQKTRTIQDTCKKQEKVIVQLEQLLAKQGKGQFNGESSDTYRTLSEENIKLQAEVMQYKEMLRKAEAKRKLPRSPPEKHVTSNGPMSDMERLELYEKLERAEGRIVSLEKQLADNVRKWAKDKAELQMKLNESVVAQKTGYKNSSTSIDILDWHNGSKPPSPSRPLGPRRPSPKLDPLDRR